jgi:ketosteroid isomerase-like protein
VSGERVQLVKEGYDAWNAGDRGWVLRHMSPDAEWITPPEDPEPGHYRGHEEIQAFWKRWRTEVGQLHFDPVEIIESDDHVIVVTKRQGRGEQSGLQVSDKIVQVFTFDGQTCIKVQEFYDRKKALQSVGIATEEAGAG